ncbi:MAG: UvrD-helicase domain-containing protein [Patescibacteria group bacterium]
MEQNQALNPAQQRVAEHQSGPLLVLAGAGAGKTKAIVHRIKHLIERGLEPDKIVAITFTNKAAEEMNQRVKKLLANTYPDDTMPIVSTFHALAVRILRADGHRLGLKKYFTILDKDDSLAAIKLASREAGVDSKRFEPRKILGAISRAKGQGTNLTAYQSTIGQEFWPRLVIGIWERYERQLAAEHSLDFDDLLLKTLELLRHHPEVLHHYQERWTHFHVDEYQDTNPAQYEIVKLLAAKHRNLCVVGDIDQSIYAWRGADFRNLMRFEKDYPDATIVRLEENYRSSQNIIAAAGQIISKNNLRIPKELFTRNPPGEKINLRVTLDETGEAAAVANAIATLAERGQVLGEVAILYRANFQSRLLEEAMLHANLPYQVVGTRFFERREIKDVLAFVKAAMNPEDIGSFKRIINVPPRGIGPATLAKVFSAQAGTLSTAAQQKWDKFTAVLEQIKTATTTHTAANLLKLILHITGWEEMLEKGDGEDLERLQNIKELVSLATKYDAWPGTEGINQLLTAAALAADQDELGTIATNRVKLMTIHAAKGLEFDQVFVTGLEQNLFPQAPRAGRDGVERDSEEERRLCYVAITRARYGLHLSYAQTRTIYGQRQVNLPSEFLVDIDPDLINSALVTDESIIDF